MSSNFLFLVTDTLIGRNTFINERIEQILRSDLEIGTKCNGQVHDDSFQNVGRRLVGAAQCVVEGRNEAMRRGMLAMGPWEKEGVTGTRFKKMLKLRSYSIFSNTVTLFYF